MWTRKRGQEKKAEDTAGQTMGRHRFVEGEGGREGQGGWWWFLMWISLATTGRSVFREVEIKVIKVGEAIVGVRELKKS